MVFSRKNHFCFYEFIEMSILFYSLLKWIFFFLIWVESLIHLKN